MPGSPLNAAERPPPNAAERQRWNDPAWTAGWVPREQLTGVVTGVLLDHLAPGRAERVLDVGSGGGRLTLAIARLVGERGRVTGVDFSTALVDLARSRARDVGATNVVFVVADAQIDRIPGAPFDAVASQFGVMFFEDPHAAFVNIAAHLGTRGRLSFACWGPLEENPWCVSPTIAGFLPDPPTPPEGAWPVGPFAFGDPGLVTGLFEDTGWAQIRASRYERRAVVERSALVDDAHALAAVPPSRRGEAEQVLAEQLAPWRRDDGRLEVPLVFWVFSAQRG